MKFLNALGLLIAASVFIFSCEDDSCTESAWYADVDGDGLGSPDSSITACEIPVGFVANMDDDNDALASGEGTVTLRFDNIVGDDELSLVEYQSSEVHPYRNVMDQVFNVDLLGYYVTEIRFRGMGDTEDYVDVVEVDAEGSTGVYQILEEVSTSQMLEFTLPDGVYNRVEFTLGVPGDIVEEGALGGVLDPAVGAWFWNWNVGYIAFVLEGNSPESGAEESDHFAIHIGGWSEPNNIQQVGLDLPHHLMVQDGSASMVHIQMDVLNAISGHRDVDFTTTFAVHSPTAGEHIAHNLTSAFQVHHVQNN